MGNNGNGASSTKEQSNLGIISGIGPTYADALCEAKICCVEELAAQQPEYPEMLCENKSTSLYPHRSLGVIRLPGQLKEKYSVLEFLQ